MEAKQFLETAIDKHFDLGSFLYKDLIDKLCKVENLEGAHDILIKMMHIGYGFDPASFMPVIDGLNKLGQKHVADELSERMLEMVSESKVGNKAYQNYRELNHMKRSKYGGDGWQAIVYRDDGSAAALKNLKRVQKGWGQGSI